MKTNYMITRPTSLMLFAVPLFGALLSTSCSSGNNVPNECPEKRQVAFSTELPSTKSTEYTSADDLTSIGVFASFAHGSFDESNATPNFMYNQKLEKDANGVWTYSPTKYWPFDPADKISFFAYAPHVDEIGSSNLSFSSQTATGYPVLTYNVPAAEAAQKDLLASIPLPDLSSGPVNFTMKHTLTKVTLSVKCGDKYAKEITSFSLNGAAAQGKLHFKDGGFEWTDIQNSRSYTPAALPLSLASTDTSRELARFFLLPQGNPPTFTITYKVLDGGGTELLTKTLTAQALPATPLWETGSHIAYTINLSEEASNAPVTATVVEWEKDEANSYEVETFYPSDVKPGDYYYSDGSWSDGGLRMIDQTKGAITWVSPLPDYVLTNPETGSPRICIGMVFSTRMSDKDKANGWTHGYVVGLTLPTGATKFAVNAATNFDIPISDTPAEYKSFYTELDGYTNTKTIKEMSGFNRNDYPAISYVMNFSTPVPSGASGWFLPAIGQLIDLWEILGNQLSTLKPQRESTSSRVNIDSGSAAIIGKRLNKAKGKAEDAPLSDKSGSDFAIDCSYMSSTEINATTIAVMHFYTWPFSGNIYAVYIRAKGAADGYAVPKAVPVLAF